MIINFNGWQRIGVVLSVLWFIFIITVATTQFFNHPERSAYVEIIPGKSRLIKGSEPHCTKPSPALSFTANEISPAALDQYLAKCGYVNGAPDRLLHLTPDHYHFMFGKLAAIAIFPVLIAWCAVYLLIFIAHWVLAGFRNREM